jgi:predicted transcriptional regulator
MVTRGFLEQFCLELTRNEWTLYLALSTFLNFEQRRAFPSVTELETVLPIDRPSRSKAFRKLIDLALVEVWAEKVGRRRRTFYRFPYIDEKGHHVGQRQQSTAEELLQWNAEGSLPPGFEWLKEAWPKSTRRSEE